MNKVYILKNYFTGWKVVADEKNVNCAKPLFNSHDTSENGLKMCRKFCLENDLKIIRECK